MRKTVGAKNRNTNVGGSTRHKSNRSRVLRYTGIAFACCAALMAVFVAGWASANTLVVAVQDRPQPETSVIMVPENALAGSARMPDVRGLSEADARQAVVDAGISASIIESEKRPAAGAPGRIVQQNPVFGTLDPTLVRITVSTQASVPEVKARPAVEVIAELQKLGARVTQERIYEPGMLVGEAIRTEPAMGEPLSETVTLFIADSPSELSLQKFESFGATGSWFNGGILFDGKQVDSIVQFNADDPKDVDDYAWNLDGKVTSIVGEYAIAEDQEPAFRASFIVLADGKEIARMNANTSPSHFEWDVRGVRTLVVRAVRTVPDEWGSIVLIDPVALGSFDDLAIEP